jgi:hypothetical protein
MGKACSTHGREANITLSQETLKERDHLKAWAKVKSKAIPVTGREGP